MNISIQKGLLFLLKKSGVFFFFLIMTIVGMKVTFSPQYGDRWFMIFPLAFCLGMLCYSLLPHLAVIKAVFTKNIINLETEIIEKTSYFKEEYGSKIEVVTLKLKGTNFIFRTNNEKEYKVGDKISLWYITRKNGKPQIIKDDRIFIYSNSVELPKSELPQKIKSFLLLCLNKLKTIISLCKQRTIILINLIKLKINNKKEEL